MGPCTFIPVLLLILKQFQKQKNQKQLHYIFRNCNAHNQNLQRVLNYRKGDSVALVNFTTTFTSGRFETYLFQNVIIACFKM